MTHNPCISVIIPNLHSTFIHRTLDALRAQTLDLYQVEVLVVGLDGPGLVTEDELVHHISTEKPATPAQARNIGIRSAKGEILCFIDADCLPAPDWLARLVAYLRDTPANVVGGGVAFQADSYWTLCDNLSWFHEFLTTTAPGLRTHLPSLNLAVRRAVIEQVGLFDERFPKAAGEDADWTIRMRERGFDLHFEPQAVVRHFPNRTTLRAVWQHGHLYGHHSAKINPTWVEYSHSPRVLRSPTALKLLSPILASWAALRIFGRNPRLLVYVHAWPGIFIGKLGWCFGAATRLVKPQISTQIVNSLKPND